MATALKDIQFNKPILVGEANASNGTTYALGSHDVIGPIAQASIEPPGGASAQTMWGFNGFATYAGTANSAYTATRIDFGLGSEHGLAAMTVGDLPSPPTLGSSLSGSWDDLLTYLNDLRTALLNISGQTIAIVDYNR